MPRRRLAPLAALSAAAVLALGACGGEDESSTQGASSEGGSSEGAASEGAAVEGSILGPDGAELGTYALAETDGGVEVTAEVTGMPPGFHGFHVHETGACEPDSANPSDPQEVGDFLSAGPHLAEEGQSHGDHAGDLPSLAVGHDGSGYLRFVTDALTMADVQDDDGSAVMVHATRDNYANIPERYAPQGPDEETTSTGDAGDRIGCGVVDPA